MKYVPNTISILRILASPVVIVLIVNGLTVAACITLLLAALSDAVDGAIARRWQVESELGKLLEPIADMALIICGLVGLLVVGAWPLWVIAPLIAGGLILQSIGWSKPTAGIWLRVKKLQTWLHPLLFIALLVTIGLWYVMLATDGSVWFIGGYGAVIAVLTYLKRRRLTDFRPAQSV